jgi:hypothetical protein
VIISNLQHIEPATETEVQGGGRRRPWRPWYQTHSANAGIEPVVFGTDTETFTSTDTLIIEDQFSDSDFNSPCESF